MSPHLSHFMLHNATYSTPTIDTYGMYEILTEYEWVQGQYRRISADIGTVLPDIRTSTSKYEAGISCIVYTSVLFSKLATRCHVSGHCTQKYGLLCLAAHLSKPRQRSREMICKKPTQSPRIRIRTIYPHMGAKNCCTLLTCLIQPTM